MNRSNTRQKRSISKSSPLSKRPKLDFNLRANDSLPNTKDNIPNGSCEKNSKNSCPTGNLVESKVKRNFNAEPDWDDDFSGDMLEKVCLIADLSQAMVNSQTVTEITNKPKVQIFDGAKLSSELIITKGNEELEKLKAEFQDLLEKFKTKEGEVHILRSQLKQNEDMKQAAALQNIKVIDDIQKKCNEKLGLTEKELETCKTKLQFKDMEYKTLSERYRQLEYSISKSKLIESQASQADACKTTRGFSEVFNQKFHNKEGESDCNSSTSLNKSNDNVPDFEFDIFTNHEGKSLEKCLCPEFFEFIEEPNVVHFYIFGSGRNYRQSKLEYEKREKYRWSDLPKPKLFLKDFHNSVSGLFVCESFSHKESKCEVEEILKSCEKILQHNKEILTFLEKLHLQNCENDDSDQSLLENEDKVEVLTIKTLLRGQKLTSEECGIEGRRTLALVSALMTTSQVAVDFVKAKLDFVEILKSIAGTIGSLRRPLRYTGILVGILFILRRLLAEKNLEKEMLKLINEVVEEIIFSRPKLDVLIEVVRVLAAGKNHFDFLTALCRKASLDSCSLYMDSKLKQAMFFTKNACPLKLLCMQIMGLACLPSSKNIRWELTDSVIKWLNNSINTPKHKEIKWLPTNSFLNEDDRCFDVTECLLYLLTLSLKDYHLGFPLQERAEDSSSYHQRTERDIKKRHLISIVGHGAVLLKRILRTDQRQLHDSLYSVRFAVLLNSLVLGKSEFSQRNQLSSVQSEAIFWLTESLEGDLKNQEYCAKPSTSTIPETDILSALKIDDESKIY